MTDITKILAANHFDQFTLALREASDALVASINNTSSALDFAKSDLRDARRYNAHEPAVLVELDLFARMLWHADNFTIEPARLAERTLTVHRVVARFFELRANGDCPRMKNPIAWLGCSGWGAPGDDECESAEEFTAQHFKTWGWNDEFCFSDSEASPIEPVAKDLCDALALIAKENPALASMCASMLTWEPDGDEEDYLPGAAEFVLPQHDRLAKHQPAPAG